MIWEKPKDVTYTQMAIYIDKHAYDEDKDEALIFQYLYHLGYILAVKKCFFKTGKDYDNFGLYVAEEMYRRLTDPAQFLPDGDPKKKAKVKSCLNYIKKVLYGFKVNYQKSHFREVISGEVTSDNNTYQIENDLKNKAYATYSPQIEVETEFYLTKITKNIKNFLSKLPMASNKLEFKRIYQSCLLTFLSSITWSNSNKKRIQNRVDKELDLTETINKIYEEESRDVLLWGLDPGQKGYIKVLINNIKSIIRKDLRVLIGSNEPSEQVIKGIIASPFANGGRVEEEEE